MFIEIVTRHDDSCIIKVPHNFGYDLQRFIKAHIGTYRYENATVNESYLEVEIHKDNTIEEAETAICTHLARIKEQLQAQFIKFTNSSE
jgi:hypothetical protein